MEVTRRVQDVFLDFETFCEVSVKDVGAWRYAMDPSCEVLCLAYSLDWGPTKIWRQGDPDPEDLLSAIEDGARVHAWNAAFEYAVWSYVQTHWPRLRRSQMRCTMALAAFHSLPLGLEKAGLAVGAKILKDKEGSRLLKKFSQPRRPTKSNPSTRIRPEDDPEDFKKLCDYCVTDVDAEIAIMDKLPLKELPGIEQEVYELDLKINERGVKIDRDAAEAIIRAASQISEMFEEEVGRIIAPGIKSSQRAEVMKWASTEYGYVLENYQADYIRSVIKEPDVPAPVKRVLEIREALGKTSVTKYGKMIECACPDDRVRGSIQYYGAQRTGRFAGRLIQVHNLPRGTVKKIEEIAHYVASMSAEDFLILFDKPMEAFSSLIRSMIVAPEGKVFYAADFSNIEGRVLAWMAGQDDVVAQFASGDDVYRHLASFIFGVPYHMVTDDQRFVGKQGVLGCFGPETLVVTNRGAVPIVCIRPDDLLWDGVEWVRHDGVIDQGVKPVIEVEGIRVTPDHGVYVDEGVMVPAAEVDWARAHAFGGLPVVESPSENCLLYRELFSYDPVTGELRHRERPTSMFANSGLARQWNRKYAGQIAGCKLANGYLATGVTGRKLEYNHIIIWEMVYGVSPGPHIDHVNGDGADNRLLNLRYANFMQNGANSGLRKNNASGFIGVSRKRSSWTAYCGGGRFGTFHTPEEAAHARDHAAVAKYGPFARLNFLENRDSHVYDILNAGPRHRFAVVTAQGVDIVTNCGYGMGGQKFLDTCIGYGRDIGFKLAKQAVTTYRKKNHMIVKFWYAVEEAAMNAIRQPGTVFKVRSVGYLVRDGYLWCKLPSGRTLAYMTPRLEDGKISYMGVDQTTSQWGRQHTYGGKLVENIVQAASRDILVESMLRAEDEGYQVVMTVHDEVVSLSDAPHAAVDHFVQTLCVVPPWARGCPIAAAGWSGDRYKKD